VQKLLTKIFISSRVRQDDGFANSNTLSLNIINSNKTFKLSIGKRCKIYLLQYCETALWILIGTGKKLPKMSSLKLYLEQLIIALRPKGDKAQLQNPSFCWGTVQPAQARINRGR
jgi:hypothetical protein